MGVKNLKRNRVVLTKLKRNHVVLTKFKKNCVMSHGTIKFLSIQKLN